MLVTRESTCKETVHCKTASTLSRRCFLSLSPSLSLVSCLLSVSFSLPLCTCVFACCLSAQDVLTLSVSQREEPLQLTHEFQTWCNKVTTPGRAHLPRTPYLCGPRGIYIYVHIYVYMYICMYVYMYMCDQRPGAYGPPSRGEGEGVDGVMVSPPGETVGFASAVVLALWVGVQPACSPSGVVLGVWVGSSPGGKSRSSSPAPPVVW